MKFFCLVFCIFSATLFKGYASDSAMIQQGTNTMQETEMIFCQSCSMPLQKSEDFGLNQDGKKNEEFCSFCFKEGKFIDPDCSVDQMITKVTGIMNEMHFPKEVIEQTQKKIPSLKRWR